MGVAEALMPDVLLGLASTAVHQTDVASVVPKSPFTSPNPGVFSSIISSLYSYLFHSSPSIDTPNVHALTIVSRMLHDSKFSESQLVHDFDLLFAALNRGDEVLPYIDMWTFDASNLDIVEQKIKELHWTAALLYASGRKGGAGNNPFWADFMT